MLRFIVEETQRDQGHVRTRVVTVDADCPELDKFLQYGGYGSGPNGDDFAYRKVIAVERKD